MKVTLVTYEGEIYKENVEWNGELESRGMYARFSGEEWDHFTAVH